MTVQLAINAFVRLQMAHRPATQNYLKMYKDLLAFLMTAGLSPSQVTPTHLLMFFEYLHENNTSASNVENYLTLSKL